MRICAVIVNGITGQKGRVHSAFWQGTRFRFWKNAKTGKAEHLDSEIPSRLSVFFLLPGEAAFVLALINARVKNLHFNSTAKYCLVPQAQPNLATRFVQRFNDSEQEKFVY